MSATKVSACASSGSSWVRCSVTSFPLTVPVTDTVGSGTLKTSEPPICSTVTAISPCCAMS
ncbi:MAG: hypothetical protein NUW37_11390 [Planctomycetes bacterium]|nr:hypothetical protein [Planctomycetota bacterium]